MKTLDPDYLEPKQFSEIAEGCDEFARACVCVEFRLTWVIPVACVCAYRPVLSLVLVSLLKTKL